MRKQSVKNPLFLEKSILFEKKICIWRVKFLVRNEGFFNLFNFCKYIIVLVYLDDLVIFNKIIIVFAKKKDFLFVF